MQDVFIGLNKTTIREWSLIQYCKPIIVPLLRQGKSNGEPYNFNRFLIMNWINTHKLVKPIASKKCLWIKEMRLYPTVTTLSISTSMLSHCLVQIPLSATSPKHIYFSWSTWKLFIRCYTMWRNRASCRTITLQSLSQNTLKATFEE